MIIEQLTPRQRRLAWFEMLGWYAIGAALAGLGLFLCLRPLFGVHHLLPYVRGVVTGVVPGILCCLLAGHCRTRGDRGLLKLRPDLRKNLEERLRERDQAE